MSEGTRWQSSYESVSLSLKNFWPLSEIGSSRSLLITLSIFHALAFECKRDIALLSPSLVNSVDVTLSSLVSDLEVVARVASVVGSLSTPFALLLTNTILI